MAQKKKQRRWLLQRIYAYSTKKTKGKSTSTGNMKKTFLNELLNKGLIDCKASTIHPKQYIYYPLTEPMISNVDINNNALLHDSKSRYNSSLSVTITIEYSLFSFLINRQNVNK
jgi:hypothetical protein